MLLLGLFSASIWFAVVPPRVSFALASLYAFARPIRKGVKPPRAPPSHLSSPPDQALLGTEGKAAGGGAAFLAPKPKLVLPDTLLYQWLDGIPLEEPTHREVPIAVQRALLDF